VALRSPTLSSLEVSSGFVSHLLQACECMCVCRLRLGLSVHLVALVPAWAAVADLAPADAAARPCVLSPASRPDPRQR
jgi:hypothetical protein